MARMGDYFKGQYLKAADLKGPVTVTIDEVRIEKVGQDEKPVVYFKGAKKGLVLNQTNGNEIARITGTDEMDSWPGARVTLYVDHNVQFKGQIVSAVRVRDITPPKPVDPAGSEDTPF